MESALSRARLCISQHNSHEVCPHHIAPSSCLFVYCPSLHSTTKHAAATTLLSLCLALHLLANLDIDLEELGYAAVEADGFALVEVGFAVRCVYAFGCAGFDEAESYILAMASLPKCSLSFGLTGCTCPKPCRFQPLPAQSFAPKRFGVFDRRTLTSWLITGVLLFLGGQVMRNWRLSRLESTVRLRGGLLGWSGRRDGFGHG
jgi:hypothetical protein